MLAAISPAVRFAFIAACMLMLADYINSGPPKVCSDIHCTCPCHDDPPSDTCTCPMHCNYRENIWLRVNEIRKLVRPPLTRSVYVATDSPEPADAWQTREELENRHQRMLETIQSYENTIASLRKDLYEIHSQYCDLYDAYIDTSLQD
ncbi:hypothetical protein DL89DRAFT_283601, partial [Linderina pennispora]